jgi:ZIP family zinc transporter
MEFTGMAVIENLLLVFVAGLITALATGLGSLPFFFFKDISDRWTVGLWGLASGIMLSASIFGLIFEGLGLQNISTLLSISSFMAAVTVDQLIGVGIGALFGAALVLVADKIIHGHEFKPREIAEADFKKLMIILGILTVHSFPEGVAIGVAFADLGLNSGLQLLGFSIPLLAVFMTIAISIHNIPEGIAISIPLRDLGLSEWRMVGAAIFSSLPQPIGAILAYYFVTIAREFLPYGFGFAAGAMILLVVHELIPEALERGESLPNDGRKELAIGLFVGLVSMIPLVIY